MTPPNSRVAVLIPVFRAQADLDRTLASLEAEDGPFDVLVVDDGSEPAITAAPSQRGRRVDVLRLPTNQGIEGALNTGLTYLMEAGYTYVARQDAGDLDLNGRIARQIAFLDSNPEIALVGSAVQFVDPDGAPLFVFRPPEQHGAIRERMKYSPAFIHPSAMLRLSALRETGLYATEYPRAEDYEFFRRIARHFAVANLPDILVVKEENPGSLSNAKRRASLISRIRIQLHYFEWASPGSYFGLLYSCALYVVPYSLVLALKHRLGSVR